MPVTAVPRSREGAESPPTRLAAPTSGRARATAYVAIALFLAAFWAALGLVAWRLVA